MELQPRYGGPEFQHLPFLKEVRRQAHPWTDAGHLVPESSLDAVHLTLSNFLFHFSSSENPGRVDWESYLISLNKDSEAQRGKGMSPLLTRRNRESVSFFSELSKQDCNHSSCSSSEKAIYQESLAELSMIFTSENANLATLFDTAILTSLSFNNLHVCVQMMSNKAWLLLFSRQLCPTFVTRGLYHPGFSV